LAIGLYFFGKANEEYVLQNKKIWNYLGGSVIDGSDFFEKLRKIFLWLIF